ncbi:MAG: creatininase family protein [Hyphomicrobiales bacterium]
MHGGDAETSLMLHFRPETVDMAKAQDFASRTVEARRRLRPYRAAGHPRLGMDRVGPAPRGRRRRSGPRHGRKGRGNRKASGRGICRLAGRCGQGEAGRLAARLTRERALAAQNFSTARPAYGLPRRASPV